MEVLAALLKRPILEIAELAGIAIMVILALGFSAFLVLRGVSALLSALHIRKIGVPGIEFDRTKKG